MNSLPERSSLVTERCTTCGGGLPCVLHDREMRRVILSGEREEIPGFEKVWEGDGIDTSTQPVWLSETKLLVRSNKTSDLALLERRQRDSDDWTVFELRIVGDLIRPSAWIRKPVVLPDGTIMISSGGQGLYQIDTRNIDPESWHARLVLDYKPIVEDRVFFVNDVKPFVLPDGSLLTLAYSSSRTYPHFGLRFYNSPSGWRSGIVKDRSGNNIFYEVGDVLQIENGFLSRDQEGILSSMLVFPEHGFARGWRWRAESILAVGDRKRLMTGPQSMGRLGRGRYVFCERNVSSIALVLLDLNSTLENRNRWRVISRAPLDRFNLFNDCILEALSSTSFLVTNNKGLIEKFWENVDGTWSSSVIAYEPRKIIRLTCCRSDPNAFFSIDETGHIVFWRVPPEKLRAYHERRAAQTASPALPSDI